MHIIEKGIIKAKNQGFTLVELMLTVAIIAILVNFGSYSFLELKNRARRSEAMTMLGALYQSETIFKTEFGVYDTRFQALGFRPDGTQGFNVGFFAPSVTNLTAIGFQGALTTQSPNTENYCTVFPTCNLAPSAATVSINDFTAMAGIGTFRAEAVGNFSNGAALDGVLVVYVDQMKRFTFIDNAAVW